MGFVKKMRSFSKKGLRVAMQNRKQPLTGGAEMHDGAPDGPHGNEAEEKNRDT
jgi:hypothetical protein